MIVCIGFIVLLIVLGIVRIRSLQVGEDSNLKASVEDPEFNIILNPIHPDVTIDYSLVNLGLMSQINACCILTDACRITN